MANETEKTILPYLNVLEVETIDKSNVTKVIVIDKDDEVKVMDGSQLATNSYFDIQNKPEINGVELNGSMTSDELGIPSVEGVDNQITEKLADYPTKEEVTAEITKIDLINKGYTKEEVDAKLEEKQGVFAPQAPLAFNEDKTQLSVDLSTYATNDKVNTLETSLEGKIDLKQDKGDYALKSDIPTKVSELTNDSNFVTEAEVSGDLAGKADKTYVDEQLATKQPVGDYATKTELAGKADSSVVESLSTQVATNTSDISIIKTKQEEDGNKIDALDKEMATKQDLLVSGTNIKTINSQSLLGEGNIEIESGSNIPFLFINSTAHLSGDFAAVKNAIANKTPFELYYVNILGYGDIAAPEVCFVSGENIQATFHFESTTANHTVVQTTITPTGVSADTSYHSYQEQLVSGTNIKTINGQDILGSGNLDISGGTTDYNQLTNKPQINSVELSGNKSLEDLGVPTKTSELTNDSGFLTSIPDEYVTETELNAGLGNKQDTLVSGTNIKTVNGESLLGSGNIDIESVSNPVTYGSGTQPQVHTILVVTQSEYDAISSKDPNTQYLIVE